MVAPLEFWDDDDDDDVERLENRYKMGPLTHITVFLHTSFDKLLDVPGSVRVFEALDSDPALVRTIDAHSPVGRIIQLKVGAQVACLFCLFVFACSIDFLMHPTDCSF